MPDSLQPYRQSMRPRHEANKKLTNTDLEKARLASNNAKRSFVQQFRMRILDNNKSGKIVDKLTADLAKPTRGNLQTTYASEFHVNHGPPSNLVDGKSISNTNDLMHSQTQLQNQIYEK